MSNTTFMILVIICFLLFALITFSLFAIGFLIGYKTEDICEKKKIQMRNNKITEETIEEKKAKKDWKRFLEYDGSTPKIDN